MSEQTPEQAPEETPAVVVQAGLASAAAGTGPAAAAEDDED
jgi:hypothetical protein